MDGRRPAVEVMEVMSTDSGVLLLLQVHAVIQRFLVLGEDIDGRACGVEIGRGVAAAAAAVEAGAVREGIGAEPGGLCQDM